MELGVVYFYTATILCWQHLLKLDKYKDIIIRSLQHLTKHQKIRVYGFVIMPNHVHLIWEMLASNGKEMPHASFMKYTAHQFLEDLRVHHPEVLRYFEVTNTTSRRYQFWERNSLPVPLFSHEVLEQKLTYIHNNPLQEKWQLADDPSSYRYSSAAFYETGNDIFNVLTHYKERW
ncbi:MAG: transposase [Cytophagales bacterium]|nr:transposase [Cytophagales bacterium]